MLNKSNKEAILSIISISPYCEQNFVNPDPSKIIMAWGRLDGIIINLLIPLRKIYPRIASIPKPKRDNQYQPKIMTTWSIDVTPNSSLRNSMAFILWWASQVVGDTTMADIEVSIFYSIMVPQRILNLCRFGCVWAENRS